MASTEYKKRKREEYEMQLFGFHSRAVYATLNGMIHEKIRAVSKKLCETLERHNSEKGATLKVDEEELVRCYYGASLPHIRNIENIVNKYIRIPDTVLLDEDKIQEKQYTEEEFADMHKNLENLQERAKTAMTLNASLKEELRTMERLESCAQDIDKLCDIVEYCDSCPDDADDKTQEIVKDYKALRKMYQNASGASAKLKYNDPITTVRMKDCDITNL